MIKYRDLSLGGDATDSRPASCKKEEQKNPVPSVRVPGLREGAISLNQFTKTMLRAAFGTSLHHHLS